MKQPDYLNLVIKTADIGARARVAELTQQLEHVK